MAKNPQPTHNLVSVLKLNANTYTIKDAWAWGEIDNIYTLIAGGVHFRGVLAGASTLADGEEIKDLTVKDGEGTKPISEADQHDGDLFIYNAGTAENPKNLEFVVSDGKYSELGSTGALKALAFADTASVTVALATSGTVNNFTPTLANTLSVTTTAADLGFSKTTGTVGITSTKATLGLNPTSATVGISTTEATLGTTTTAATLDVTTTTAAATGSFTPASTVVAASPVTITPTTDTGSLVTAISYNGSDTLTLTTGASAGYWKGVDSAQAAGQTITYADQSISVSYDKATGVTGSAIAGVSITGATHVLATANLTGTQEFLTGASITGAENVLATAGLTGTTTFVTEGSITGSALASATLDGAISVNQVTGVTVALGTTDTKITVTPDAV